MDNPDPAIDGRFRCFLVASLALALVASCASNDDSARPTPTPRPRADLQPVSATTFCTGCAPYRLSICVGNEGNGAGGDFDIAVNGAPVAAHGGLGPGEEACVEVPYLFFGTGGRERDVLWVDSGQTVDESNEDNNTRVFPKPNPTGCDVACVPTATPPPTPPPGSTPNPSATPTATAAPTPAVHIVRVGGSIAETLPDGCAAPVPGATVELQGADGEEYSTVARTNGVFSLVVPQGAYRARYSHPSYQSLEEVDFVVDAVELQFVRVQLVPLEARQRIDDPTTGFRGGVSASGEHVSGATLVFEREIDGLTRSGSSNQTGSYRIMLPRGRYYASASHPVAGVQPRSGFFVLCEPGIKALNFSLYHLPTPTPTHDPENAHCGDGHVDEGEECEPAFGFCGGGCGVRYCVDHRCRSDCTCPSVEFGGDSCLADAFHDPGCKRPECANCVCEADPLCCETEWDPLCSRQARTECAEVCR